MESTVTEVHMMQAFEMTSMTWSPMMSPVLAPQTCQAQQNQCYVPYAAYDIGSGVTKYMGAVVDVCKLTIEEVFSQGATPVGYRQDLLESQSNQFSDLIIDMGLHALEAAKAKIESDYSFSKFKDYGDIEHIGVATAAFRAASNGSAVAESFSEKLEIPISVISQEEEGKLAYYSAMMEHPSDDSAPIVWDIGGGSMQLTFQDHSSEFHIMGGDLASQTFLSLMLNEVLQKEVTDTPYPMNVAQVDAAIELAKAKLVFDENATSIISQQIQNGAQVLAVGTVHNAIIQPLCHLIDSNGDFYSKEQLHQAISMLTDKNKDEVLALMPDPNPNFVNNQLSNLILVYAMMDKMGIDEVTTVQASNVQGVMYQAGQTRPQAIDYAIDPVETKPALLIPPASLRYVAIAAMTALSWNHRSSVLVH